jgi:hypothetical protein
MPLMYDLTTVQNLNLFNNILLVVNYQHSLALLFYCAFYVVVQCVVFLQGSQYVHAFFLYYLFISVLLLENQLSKAVVIPLTDLKPIFYLFIFLGSFFLWSAKKKNKIKKTIKGYGSAATMEYADANPNYGLDWF